MKNRQLNPSWLYAAFVYNEAGERIGTVRHVENNGDTVLVGITDSHTNKTQKMSASDLDKKGLIKKPNSIHKKYV